MKNIKIIISNSLYSLSMFLIAELTCEIKICSSLDLLYILVLKLINEWICSFNLMALICWAC